MKKFWKTLQPEEVPVEILEKLSPFSGQRFKSEKAFKKEMKSVLTLKEQQELGTHDPG